MAHFFSSWLSLGSGGGRFVTSFASSASYAFFTASALCTRSFVAGSSPPHHGPWPSTHASTAFAGRLGHATATAATRSATRRSKLSAVAPTATSNTCVSARILHDGSLRRCWQSIVHHCVQFEQVLTLNGNAKINS